ncbi:protein Per1p [Trichomonascus vanleenenianus]|uniref:Per1p n=1 Tax=Trichomonascus vanleenenianus TaxID=2268995 RepID=UPI003ECB4408
MKIGVLAVLSAITAVVNASVGDRLPQFQECVQNCIDVECQGKAELPTHLKFLLWDCPQDCDYVCQRGITAQRIESGQEVVQFHGKWPFLRVYGVQEPASVIFSILNLIPHYHGFRMIQKVFKDEKKYDIHLGLYYKVFAIIGMNAWFWSSVFHTRDFIVTERLDYFGAGLTILYGLYTALVRIFRLDKRENKLARRIVTAACVLVYLGHVGYLTLIRWSYSYNMAFGVIVGLIQNVLWSVHAFRSYFKMQNEQLASSQRHNGWALWPFFIVLSISCGMAFELLDFPPIWDAVDAHSLWHAATIVPCYWWYWWMQKDYEYLKATKRKG